MTEPRTGAGQRMRDIMAADPCDCMVHRDPLTLIAAIEAEAAVPVDDDLRADALAYIEAMHKLNAALRVGARTPEKALDTLTRLDDVPKRLALSPVPARSEPTEEEILHEIDAYRAEKRAARSEPTVRAIDLPKHHHDPDEPCTRDCSGAGPVPARSEGEPE